MGQHYTKTTVEVSHWCLKCKAFTMHHVQGGRLGSCQACIKRLENEPKQPPKAVQQGLFGG